MSKGPGNVSVSKAPGVQPGCGVSWCSSHQAHLELRMPGAERGWRGAGKGLGGGRGEAPCLEEEGGMNSSAGCSTWKTPSLGGGAPFPPGRSSVASPTKGCFSFSYLTFATSALRMPSAHTQATRSLQSPALANQSRALAFAKPRLENLRPFIQQTLEGLLQTRCWRDIKEEDLLPASREATGRQGADVGVHNDRYSRLGRARVCEGHREECVPERGQRWAERALYLATRENSLFRKAWQGVSRQSKGQKEIAEVRK